nr:hypothetical protein [Actinomadura darangshiensis]
MVVDRADAGHLYAETARTSKDVASTGSQPTAWVASATTSAPCARAAATTSPPAATSPVADWTRLKATASVRSSIAWGRSAGGTVRTSRSCTSQGNRFEVCSMSGTTTRDPDGSEAATGASTCEAEAPTATSSDGTPTRRAKAVRARPVDRSHLSQPLAPRRHSASALCSASNAGSGGMP